MQVLNHGWQRIQIVGFQLKEINLLLKIPDVLIFNISNCSIRCGRSGMFSEKEEKTIETVMKSCIPLTHCG